MWYTFWMTNRWLLLNFDALGALGVLVTALFALAGFVGAGLAGVCMSIFSEDPDQATEFDRRHSGGDASMLLERSRTWIIII
jgi:hypothetical protein